MSGAAADESSHSNNNNNSIHTNASEVETFSFPDLTVHVSVMMPEAVPNTPELAAAHRRVRQSIVATVMQHLTNARSMRLPIAVAAEPIVASLPLPTTTPIQQQPNPIDTTTTTTTTRPWQGMPLMPLVVSLLNALSGGGGGGVQPAHHHHPAPDSVHPDLGHEYSFGDFSTILNALFLRARPRPQPAAEAAISALHRGPLSSELLARALECAICKDEFAADDIGVTLPCNALHVFHEPCLLPWLREHHHTCPLCRHKLPIADELAAAPPPPPLAASSATSVQPLNDDVVLAAAAVPSRQLRRSRRTRRSVHPTADLRDAESPNLRPSFVATDDDVDADADADANDFVNIDAAAASSQTAAAVDDEAKRAAAGEHADDAKRSKRRRRG